MSELKRLIPNWERVQVHPTAEIDVRELAIGDGSIIGPGVVIEGTRVVIGRHGWIGRVHRRGELHGPLGEPGMRRLAAHGAQQPHQQRPPGDDRARIRLWDRDEGLRTRQHI